MATRAAWTSPPATASAVAEAMPDQDGSVGGSVTRSALPAAAISPAFELSPHAIPAAKHHSAATAVNTTPNDEKADARSTAPPMTADTAITSGIRPRGLSCRAVAPAIAAAPAAAMAALVPSQ